MAVNLNASAEPLVIPAEEERCCPDREARLQWELLDDICSREDVVGSERSTSNENALETDAPVERGVVADAKSGGGGGRGRSGSDK
jgi:hypothetical protein